MVLYDTKRYKNIYKMHTISFIYYYYTFFSFILYSIRVNFIITSLLGIIGIGLSIVWRIRVFKEYHKEPFIITISEEEKDDLVEYIDDRICIENFNKEPNLRIPISFSGINFGYK